MGAEKHKSNGGYVGGILQLFDWNAKSRKKLFASKSDVPDGVKQGKKHDNNLPATRFHLTDDEAGGLASVRGGSDYSCASSVTEDEGARAPGVVARLMGLESLPTSSSNEPYATPSFDSRSLQDSYYHKSNAEFLNDYRAMYSRQQLYKFDDRSEVAEPKPPKLSTRPIEKFQSESLPPKTAKPMPLTHHKLLSPIKSPGFISPKSAAHIMEAAAKILDPSLHAMPRGQFSSFSSSSATNKVGDFRENSVISSRNQTKISEASRRTVDSNASKLLKGQSLTKSWNGSDEAPVFKVSPEMNDQFVAGSKNNGRSVSLAVQAKVNVLKRESLNSSSKTVVFHKDDDDVTPKQSFRIQRNTVKNEQSRPSTLSVLRQNNQKQNFAGNRDKLGSKSYGSSQQVKKVSSSEKVSSKSLSKDSAIGKVGFKTECNDVSGPVKMDASSSSNSKHFPRKKRAIASDVSDKANFVHANLVDRNARRMQPHLGINEHSSDVEGVGKRGMDVVSFTFTSPMNKSSSQSPDWKTEKLENFTYISPRSEKNSCTSKGKKVSSLGLNVIGGDELSILLEQKLRELTSEIESSSTNSVKGGSSTSMCILQDLVSAFNSASTNQSEFDGRHFPHAASRTDVESVSIFSLPDPPARKTNIKLQNAKEMVVDDSFIGTIDGDQYQRPSPVSILDASFSIESFHSSEGADAISGCMESSVEANLDMTVSSKTPSLSSAEHAELSDCASSSGQSSRFELDSSSKCQVVLSNPQEQPLVYIKHVVSQTRKSVESFLLGRSNEILDPAVFDKLENEGDETHGHRLLRKALFDCVGECLNTQYGHYVKTGYSSWSRGMVVLRSSDRVASEIYKEISDWKNMSEWMVDELVDKDMSSHLGKWTNFDIEGFELGVEVEEAVLSSLLDEVVADLLV